jgi:hypothetical protein
VLRAPSSTLCVSFQSLFVSEFLTTSPLVLFNAQALQLGITLGLAIAASITQSIDQNRIKKGQDPGYHGIADSFWFMIAFIVTLFIAVQVFYKPEPKIPVADAEGGVVGSVGVVGAGNVEVSRVPFIEDVQEKEEKHEAR